MNTSAMNLPYREHHKGRELPTTSRGRALYTVDWFLNGRPVLSNHDNPRVSLLGRCGC